jgi:hypothetical protein
MEATGVYWKPAWHILTTGGSVGLVFANAQHVKALRGASATFPMPFGWALHAHGPIRGSLPPREGPTSGA